MILERHQLFSDAHYQSVTWTIVYLLHPVFIYIVKGDIDVLLFLLISALTCFFCYYFCTFFVKVGRKLIKNESIGGHLGGFVGMILFTVLLHSLLFLIMVHIME